MTFRRGAALTTVTTLGYSDGADLGPTAGNGFYRTWPDDLAALQELGISDVRLTLDWARLQQKPGDLDGDWVERFTNMLEAAEAIGLRAWATLYDGSLPRWFDNEGGLGDQAAFDKWWPRWVERAADVFGGRVDGWVPFDVIPAGAAQPWRDTWGILGGEQPVMASIADGAFDTAATYQGRADLVGVELVPVWEPDAEITDVQLDEAADRWGTTLRITDETFAGAGVTVAGFEPSHDDHDQCARIVERFVEVIDAAIDDRVAIDVAFVEPAIAGPESVHGLLGNDRNPTATAEVYLPTSK